MKKGGKINLMATAQRTAIVTVGAYAGIKASDAIEKTFAKAGNAKANRIAPLVTLGVGLIGQMFVRNEMLNNLFLGMTVVSATEALEKAEVMTTPTPAPAIVEGVRKDAYSPVNGVRRSGSKPVNGYRRY